MSSSTISSATCTTLPPSSSLEDQEVRRLCESGDLTQGAGSQSLLSQELLLEHQSQQSQSQSQSESQSSPPTEEDIMDLDFVQSDDKDADTTNTNGNNDADSGDLQVPLSAATAQDVTAAPKYGILAQDGDGGDDGDGHDDDGENQENAPANSQAGRARSSIRSGTGVVGTTTSSMKQKHQQPHAHARRDAANMTTRSTTSLLLLLPLPAVPLPISFPMPSLSAQENRGIHADGTSVPAYDDTMDLVMELDEAYSGLDAIKLAATGNRGKKRSMMNKSNTSTAGPTTLNVFGSLLDAVQVVQRQSMSPRNSSCLQKQQQQRQHAMDPHMTTTGNLLFPPAHAQALTTPAEVANAGTANKKQKSQRPQGKQKETVERAILNSLSQPPLSLPAATSTSKRQAVAQRAAALAVRVSSDADLAKRLLLSMVLLRDNPRQWPSPSAGHFLEDGFFWAHYPPLEQILKDNMARYYALSIGKCQSPEQFTFNNTLVVLVRQTVAAREWSFDRMFMCDKVLRNRIRSYYKTHIQNAKKRLRTMLKNPTKNANAIHLIQHWELIRETIVSKQQSQMPMNSYSATASSSTSSPSNMSDSNNDSGSNKEDEKKVTKKAAARRVTMEEAAMEKAAMEAEDIAWGKSIRFDEQK
jgi:hypothetical protein